MKIFDHPFRHLVLDHLLQDEDLRAIANEWPETDTSKLAEMTPGLRHLVYDLSQQDTLVDLGKVFQHDLLPDPRIITHGQLWDAGARNRYSGSVVALHQCKLDHPAGLKRRVNLMIFMSDDWAPEWSSLQFTDIAGSVAKIPTTFGKVVAFDGAGYHGFPEPLNCDTKHRCRRLELAYYSIK